MSDEEFYAFVARICFTLETISKTEPQRIAACKSGEAFEACVVDVVKHLLRAGATGGEVHYTPGGHAFPDIVIEFPDGTNYGIEVKSSSSTTSKSWKINGNSVLGSTKEDVLDTYIVFGKTAMGHQAFRFKRYEDAVANVVVTHSPRYYIDMDLAPHETFFDQSGLSYRQISEAKEPISLITDYFKAQGQRAWWLAESSPAAIRMFSELSLREQGELIGYCFAHFPEIFSNSPKKFSRCAMWLVTDRSVVSPSLRDSFTAGGRVDLALPGMIYYDIPQIFNNLRLHRKSVLSALAAAPALALREDWQFYGVVEETLEWKVTAWISITAGKFLPKCVHGYGKRALLRALLLA